jgi:hypothetical protein
VPIGESASPNTSVATSERPHFDTVTGQPSGDGVALLNARCVALDRQQAVVDRVPIERPREALREHRPDPGRENDRRRHLHRRAAAEVAAGDEEVTLSNRRGEGGIDDFQQVLLQTVASIVSRFRLDVMM